ncbi:MAG: undecaprenyl-diphosphate phosphatase [Rhodospirillaceae bacterium]|nr:undecaprenyl-diphosphate phosphatase [Rhodospirillaceae bacterium]
MHQLQLVDLITLALIEGVADLLPVDSSAHALLASWLLHWRAGPIVISIHAGAAIALLLYFWRDVGRMGLGVWRLAHGRVETGGRLLGKVIAVATPWAVAAAMGGRPVPGPDLLPVVGAITLVSAILMLLIDRLSMTVKRIEHLSLASVAGLALLQLLALIPGVGRVVALLSGARLLGMERADAYRFVLLVQIPILLVQAVAEASLCYRPGALPSMGDLLMAAITIACVLPAVALSMAWMRRFGLTPFAVYRLGVGAALIGLTVL